MTSTTMVIHLRSGECARFLDRGVNDIVDIAVAGTQYGLSTP